MTHFLFSHPFPTSLPSPFICPLISSQDEEIYDIPEDMRTGQDDPPPPPPPDNPPDQEWMDEEIYDESGIHTLQ